MCISVILWIRLSLILECLPLPIVLFLEWVDVGGRVGEEDLKRKNQATPPLCMAEEKTTQLLCCHVHCRVRNVAHECQAANQTVVQLISCVPILSVL